MKKFIFLLFFIPLGCSVESSAVQETPTVVESEPAIVKNLPNEDCATGPLLEIYEEFVELGIKSSNLTTEKANITFKKIRTPEAEIKSMISSEFGTEFLKSACSFNGLIFSIDDVRNSYVGTYQINFNSEKSATEASNILVSLDRRHFRTKKVATLFNWRVSGTSILITYNSPSVTEYYNKNVSDFSK